MNKTIKGFTLLELLVSLTILVIVVLTVYVSFRLGLKTYRRQEKNSYINQNMRQAWRMISRDLRCAFVSDSKDIRFIGEQNFDGKNDKVNFVTYLPEIYGREGGLAEVSYYVDNDPNTDCEGLIRENRGFPYSLASSQQEGQEGEEIINTAKIQEIAPLVRSFKLQYFDSKSWQDTWGKGGGIEDLSATLPVSVKISITLLDEETNEEKSFETVAPVYSSMLAKTGI